MKENIKNYMISHRNLRVCILSLLEAFRDIFFVLLGTVLFLLASSISDLVVQDFMFIAGLVVIFFSSFFTYLPFWKNGKFKNELRDEIRKEIIESHE